MDNREYLMVKHELAQTERDAILSATLNTLSRCALALMAKLNMPYEDVVALLELNEEEQVAVATVLGAVQSQVQE